MVGWPLEDRAPGRVHVSGKVVSSPHFNKPYISPMYGRGELGGENFLKPPPVGSS